MKKQKRRGLAFLLAFVMLVSLLYVPGSSLNAYAEGEEQNTDPDSIIQVEQIKPLVIEEEPEPPVLTEEEEMRLESNPTDMDSSNMVSGMDSASVMSNNLTLTPGSGTYFNGENASIKVENVHNWGYGYRVNSGAWRWVVKSKEIEISNDASVLVVDIVGWNFIFPIYAYATGEYDFIDPPQPSGLDLESRTLSELTVVWDASTDMNIEYYNVYVKNGDGWDEPIAVTDPTHTFTGLDRGQTLDIGVSAVYKGHVVPTDSFESTKAEETFKTADYEVTTRILPTEAGSVAPQYSYWDEGEMMSATATLNEGYEVKRWIFKKLSSNPVARVLGFGETETIDVETAEPIDDEAPAEEDSSPSFAVDGDYLITAKAGLKVFTVKVSADPIEAGTASATIESGKQMQNPNRYQYGTVLNLIATPNPGYMLDCWINGEGNEISSPYTVEGNDKITGIFVKEPVGFVEESITVDELNDGMPIEFSGFEARSVEEVEVAGAPADRQMHAEVGQDVSYGTTLEELLYHVNLKALDNNGVKIKDGDGFVDLDSLDLSQAINPDGSIDFEVFNTESMTLIHNNNTALTDPLKDGGEYRIKFKLYHNEDSRFNETSTAMELSGEPYQNEVVVYTLHVKINVLDPVLNLEIQEGGNVSIAARMNRETAAEDVSAVAMFSDDFDGPYTFTRSFKDNRLIDMTAVPQNAAAYKFDGWYYTDEPETLYSSDSSITIPMNQNWNLIAKFSKLDYVIEADPSMTQGKIQYRLMNQDKKVENIGWTDLPVTIHYGDRVQLKAVPSATWLFKEWITPDTKQGNDAADIQKKMFRDRSEIRFLLDDYSVTEFENFVMSANAEFMSDYGFTDYHVAGIEDGADLLSHDSVGSVDESSVKSKKNIITFDYHVPYGTEFEDAMNDASFDVTYGLINPSNIVKLYGANVAGPVLDDVDYRYYELVGTPHTVKISDTIDPFEQSGENQFTYRYSVQQYADQETGTEPSVEKERRDEYNLSKEYLVIVTVVIDDPLLTVEVPVGGTVTREAIGFEYPETSPMPTVAVVDDTPVVDVLAMGYHYKNYEVGTIVSLIPTASEGYTFTGWTTTDGYQVPEDNSVVMLDNYKVKPIFTVNPTTRRHRNNNTTPQQEIAEIQDETTPLGILYRQLFVGYPNGDLRMFDTINRAQLSLILQRAQQYDVSAPPTIPVTDVMDEWYRKEALVALGKGYMTLRPGNIFAGNAPVTGEELITALNKAFGTTLTLEQAYELANGVSSEQLGKIMISSATDFQIAMSGLVPLGVGSFDAKKPVPRETVARIVFAVLYPQAPAEPEAPATPE